MLSQKQVKTLSVMEVDGPDISKYGVVVPDGRGAGIAGLIEKPAASGRLQTLHPLDDMS